MTPLSAWLRWDLRSQLQSALSTWLPWQYPIMLLHSHCLPVVLEPWKKYHSFPVLSNQYAWLFSWKCIGKPWHSNSKDKHENHYNQRVQKNFTYCLFTKSRVLNKSDQLFHAWFVLHRKLEISFPDRSSSTHPAWIHDHKVLGNSLQPQLWNETHFSWCSLLALKFGQIPMLWFALPKPWFPLPIHCHFQANFAVIFKQTLPGSS